MIILCVLNPCGRLLSAQCFLPTGTRQLCRLKLHGCQC